MEDSAIQDMMFTAKRIIEAESRHNFDVYAIDDSEHIPRMERLATSVREALFERGLAPEPCDASCDDLIEYARQLYLAEWMRPLPGDETLLFKKDAIRDFNQHLKRRNGYEQPEHD